MLRSSTLNLEEDKKAICDIFSDYLQQYTISEWKYETALKILVDNQLEIEPSIDNLKELGNLYLQECVNNYQDRNANCNVEEKEKIESLKQSIHKI